MNPRRFDTATNINVEVESQNAVNLTYLGTYPDGGAPAFPAAPSDGPSGVILVYSDLTIPTNSQQLSVEETLNVGIAMNSRTIVSVQLLPNQTYQFTPEPTYYIIAGSFLVGQVVDTAISTSAFEIKYQGITDQTVIFKETNQFELK